MPLKIIHPDHIEVMGRGLVLLSGNPTTGANRDLYTGQIVEEAALLAKSWAIIATERKQPNMVGESPLATSDFDRSVKNFVEEYGIKCVVAIVGTVELGIAVKSQGDGSVSEEIIDIIRSGLEPHFSVNPDTDQSRNRLLDPRAGDRGADNSSAQSVQIFHIELGLEERSFRKDQIVSSVADIVGLINAKLGFSEGASGVLD